MCCFNARYGSQRRLLGGVWHRCRPRLAGRSPRGAAAAGGGAEQSGQGDTGAPVDSGAPTAWDTPRLRKRPGRRAAAVVGGQGRPTTRGAPPPVGTPPQPRRRCLLASPARCGAPLRPAAAAVALTPPRVDPRAAVGRATAVRRWGEGGGAALRRRRRAPHRAAVAGPATAVAAGDGATRCDPVVRGAPPPSGAGRAATRRAPADTGRVGGHPLAVMAPGAADGGSDGRHRVDAPLPSTRTGTSPRVAAATRLQQRPPPPARGHGEGGA